MFSSEYKQKYDEIVKQNGILTIDSRVCSNGLFCNFYRSNTLHSVVFAIMWFAEPRVTGFLLRM